MYYVYILKSSVDNKLYTGYTKNLRLRFKCHNEGKVTSTAKRRPFILVSYEACLNQQDATHREKYFKTYRGKQFLKNRLKSYFTG